MDTAIDPVKLAKLAEVAVNVGVGLRPGQDLILQKSAFLASEVGVQLSIHFSKRFSTGLFGGEGFIMQRLSGCGIAFAEIDGDVVTYDLQPGQ